MKKALKTLSLLLVLVMCFVPSANASRYGKNVPQHKRVYSFVLDYKPDHSDIGFIGKHRFKDRDDDSDYDFSDSDDDYDFGDSDDDSDHGYNDSDDSDDDHGHGYNDSDSDDHGHGYNDSDSDDYGHGYNDSDDSDDDYGHNPPVVPEPISSILFLVGGATLGFRRMRKRG